MATFPERADSNVPGGVKQFGIHPPSDLTLRVAAAPQTRGVRFGAPPMLTQSAVRITLLNFTVRFCKLPDLRRGGRPAKSAC